jgi:hypothetical protein
MSEDVDPKPGATPPEQTPITLQEFFQVDAARSLGQDR